MQSLLKTRTYICERRKMKLTSMLISEKYYKKRFEMMEYLLKEKLNIWTDFQPIVEYVWSS